MNSTPFHSPEILLAHSDWVRALAARLVADPQGVDDVVQDALTVALESGPREPGALRSWLGTVVRNLVRQNWRSSQRRMAREVGSARPEALPDAGQVLERLSSHRAVVAAVSSLEEPYRRTLLLRYFDGYAPRMIAEMEGVPVKTVKTRLARGIVKLRASLAQQHGKDEWLLALAPLLRVPAPPVAAAQAAIPKATLGALLLKANLQFLIAVLLIGGLLIGVWLWPPADMAGTGLNQTSAAALADGELLATGGSAAGRRTAADLATPEEPGRAQAGSLAPALAPARQAVSFEPVAIVARIFDETGAPAGGVALKLVIGAEQVALFDEAGLALRSTPDGKARFMTRRGGRLHAADPRWTTLMVGMVDLSSSSNPAVVVAPAIAVAGHIEDGQGAAVAGAQIEMRLPMDFDARFGDALESSQHWRSTRTSAEDGAFEWDSLPLVPGSFLIATAEGFERAEARAPQQDAGDLVMVLLRHQAISGEIKGRVIDPAGAPVEGARVALGLFTTLSDAAGEFNLSLADAVATERIIALKRGYQPAVLERPAHVAADAERAGWPQQITLSLGAETLTISGVVQGIDGKPLAGARVWIADPTPFGLLDGRPLQMEALLAGGGVEDGGGGSIAGLAAGLRAGGYFDLDDSPRAPSAEWNWSTTDAAGHFRIEGLMSRSYTLAALDERTLVMETLPDIQAGSQGVELRLSRRGMLAEVRGRVFDPSGQPLAGVRVSTEVVPFKTQLSIGAGLIESRMSLPGPETTTDAEGRFAFQELPADRLRFSLSGDTVLPTAFTPPEDADMHDLRVVAQTRCHVEVVLQDPARADGMRFLDAAGELLEVFVIRAGSVQVHMGARLVDGRSGVVAISGRATTLVLQLAGENVEEIPIRPVAGQVLQVRP